MQRHGFLPFLRAVRLARLEEVLEDDLGRHWPFRIGLTVQPIEPRLPD